MAQFDRQSFGRDKRPLETQLREVLIDPMSGTTFPTDPAVNPKFFDTTRDIEYFWSTEQELWLSANLYQAGLPVVAGGLGELTADGYVAIPNPHVNRDRLFLEEVRVAVIPTLANGVNYFNLYVSAVKLSGSLDVATLNTLGLGSVRTLLQSTPAVVLPLDVVGFTAYAEKVGTAGSHTFYVGFSYRLVG